MAPSRRSSATDRSSQHFNLLKPRRTRLQHTCACVVVACVGMARTAMGPGTRPRHRRKARGRGGRYECRHVHASAAAHTIITPSPHRYYPRAGHAVRRRIDRRDILVISSFAERGYNYLRRAANHPSPGLLPSQRIVLYHIGCRTSPVDDAMKKNEKSTLSINTRFGATIKKHMRCCTALRAARYRAY